MFHINNPLAGGVRIIKRSGGCRLRLEQHRGGGSALDCVEEVSTSGKITLVGDFMMLEKNRRRTTKFVRCDLKSECNNYS